MKLIQNNDILLNDFYNDGDAVCLQKWIEKLYKALKKDAR